jgi:hypothetical protein
LVLELHYSHRKWKPAGNSIQHPDHQPS